MLNVLQRPFGEGADFRQLGEPTIPEILSDPIIKALMIADGIDPNVLEMELRVMAHEIAAARNVRPPYSHFGGAHGSTTSGAPSCHRECALMAFVMTGYLAALVLVALAEFSGLFHLTRVGC